MKAHFYPQCIQKMEKFFNRRKVMMILQLNHNKKNNGNGFVLQPVDIALNAQ
jgi:hypothetical protein